MPEVTSAWEMTPSPALLLWPAAPSAPQPLQQGSKQEGGEENMWGGLPKSGLILSM